MAKHKSETTPREQKTAETREVSTKVDFGDDTGAGYELQTQDDTTIPFLNLLQQGSPEVLQGSPSQVKGAVAGSFFNPVTQALYTLEQGVTFIPVLTEHVFVEWVPRDSGGGFVGIHQPQDPIVLEAIAGSEEFGKYIRKGTVNQLTETFYIFALLYHEKTPGDLVVMAFTSKKIKEYKTMNTRLKMCMVEDSRGQKRQPPLFAHRVKMTSFLDQKDEFRFFNVKLFSSEGNVMESLLNPGDPQESKLYAAAREAYQLIASGKRKVDYTKQQTDSQGESGDGAAGGKAFF